MDFFIRQYATLPIICMELTNDARIDYRKFNEMLENSLITFSMIDIDGNYKIANKEGFLLLKTPSATSLSTQDEYYICYKFCSDETNEPGTYTGQFRIDFLNIPQSPFDEYGVLIAPIKRELNIHVKESYAVSNPNLDLIC